MIHAILVGLAFGVFVMWVVAWMPHNDPPPRQPERKRDGGQPPPTI